MKKLARFALVLLITLVTLLTLNALVESVKAADSTSFQVSLSSSSKGVNEDAVNTFIVTNTGTAQIGAINVTNPTSYNNTKNLGVSSQPNGQSWIIKRLGNSTVLTDSSGLSSGQSLTFTIEAKNPQAAGTYKWTITGDINSTAEGLILPAYTAEATTITEISTITAAIIIFGIAACIAILNTGLNRVLINYFVGWEQYRVMQKEMNEYRQETMAAARANDKKQMEKLKKKQSQVNAMQSKMMKPQMVQFGISFLYIFVWFFVLTPTFGNTSLVYLPGFGPVSVIYWYPIASFFLGLLGSRLLGIMPIEN